MCFINARPPGTQAKAQQHELRHASIEPSAWVIDQSIAATDTTGSLLQARLQGESGSRSGLRAGCRGNKSTGCFLATPRMQQEETTIPTPA